MYGLEIALTVVFSMDYLLHYYLAEDKALAPTLTLKCYVASSLLCFHYRISPLSVGLLL